jgi:hypothetical protein
MTLGRKSWGLDSRVQYEVRYVRYHKVKQEKGGSNFCTQNMSMNATDENVNIIWLPIISTLIILEVNSLLLLIARPQW